MHTKKTASRGGKRPGHERPAGIANRPGWREEARERAKEGVRKKTRVMSEVRVEDDDTQRERRGVWK